MGGALVSFLSMKPFSSGGWTFGMVPAPDQGSSAQMRCCNLRCATGCDQLVLMFKTLWQPLSSTPQAGVCEVENAAERSAMGYKNVC